VFPRFSQRYPGIEIVVQEDTTAELLAALAVCELDVAIASLPIQDERLQTETLFSEELLVALPRKHPLVKRKSIRATDLESERFILMKEGHCLGDQVLSFCAGRNFHPRVLCRSAQMETICALVRVGMGISLVPEMACQGTRSPGLCYRSISAPTPRRTIVALWRRNRPPGRALNAFIHNLRTIVSGKAGNP
jgi:LysR family hydrogen peroxide-inducible transcriptional activator